MTVAVRFEERPGGFGVLTIDAPGKPVNTLSRGLLAAIRDEAGKLSVRADLRGLIVRSGKPGQFLAGADLREVAGLEGQGPEALEAFIDLGREAFARLGALPFPVVAEIDGPCLGGGLELALALDDRIASESDRTTLGTPEVSVGLIPAWGGTQRLIRRLGLPALELLATGEPVGAARAAAIGLVYDAVPAAELDDRSRARLERLRKDDFHLAQRARLTGPLEIGPRAMASAVRAAIGRARAREGSAAAVALKVASEGARLPLEDGLEREREGARLLFGQPGASNRIAVFFLRNRALKKRVGIEAEEVRRVGVLGAGQMGAGIAAATARAGIETVLVDVDENRVADGLGRIEAEESRRIRSGRAALGEVTGLGSRIETATSISAFGGCDLVIEAVPEDVELKRRVYRELAHSLPADAILATNTTTISIDLLAEAVADATRFVGMHFFHPVERMELVEVIRGGATSDRTVATAVELARKVGKIPIVVNDGPGFLVSRVLFPYLNEGMILVEEGAHLDEVDAAAVAFGMPMGPIALADLIGLDTVAAAGRLLARAFPDRAVVSPLLDAMVSAGRLGRKAGLGFWRYEKGEARPDPELVLLLGRHRSGDRSPPVEEATRRLFLPMLLEAVRALEEGIVEDPGDVDLALILGIGFPVERGGLLRWCDRETAGKILRWLEPFRGRGGRFEPSGKLESMAERGERFFSE
jgi:3-hydroxyacyl-CoA dehydrogenase/enoyl-CoA hydratase/3-hydroxybutyryl-CoA epimerase/3-hydroxyacyl-CoA dehydrogenase/enoyl-CoA hydratase/3-hydroxybutyryl-CoA epimerase/enoyl-CoA isomerase